MNRLARIIRALVVGVIASAAALSLAQAANASPPGPPGFPALGAIAVPAGNRIFLFGKGKGVQIYTCDGRTWGAATPRADLFGYDGKLIITHFAGPTWQATDGSSVVGQRVNGVTVDPTAVPWLLLSAKSTAAGPGGGDRLVDTSFIQRVRTTGGVAPSAAECTTATPGKVAEVPYTADYVFWKPIGKPGA